MLQLVRSTYSRSHNRAQSFATNPGSDAPRKRRVAAELQRETDSESNTPTNAWPPVPPAPVTEEVDGSRHSGGTVVGRQL